MKTSFYHSGYSDHGQASQSRPFGTGNFILCFHVSIPPRTLAVRASQSVKDVSASSLIHVLCRGLAHYSGQTARMSARRVRPHTKSLLQRHGPCRPT